MKILNSTPKLLILCGLPASGKSTYANAWGAEDPENRRRINYDDLRIELYGDGWKFNRPEENAMKKVALDRAKKALSSGLSVVIDNTNLSSNVREVWINLAKSLGVESEVFEIDTPLEVCVQRDRLRQGTKRVGRAVIERMALFHGMIDWSSPKYGERAKDFVIVDVDGTIADCEWRRKEASKGGKLDWPKFFSLVSNDKPIERIVRLVRLISAHYRILVVSGRPIDSCGIATEDWLEKHGQFFYDHLFMRSHPSTPDYEVKQEILDLLPKERIAFVLDDRDQVVKMWRANGITCLQVADGDF